MEIRISHVMQIISNDTICMKYQYLFSGKNKKKKIKMSAEIFIQNTRC